MGDPGGDGDIGDAHKRSNGVNGDETERPGWRSHDGATARRRRNAARPAGLAPRVARRRGRAQDGRREHHPHTYGVRVVPVLPHPHGADLRSAPEPRLFEFALPSSPFRLRCLRCSVCDRLRNLRNLRNLTRPSALECRLKGDSMAESDQKKPAETAAQPGMTRRSFVTTAAAAGAGVVIVPRHVLGRGLQAPSDTVNVAIVGIGGMGGSNARALMSQNIVAICDVDDTYAGKKLDEYKTILSRSESASGRSANQPPPKFTAAQIAANQRRAATNGMTDLQRFMEQQLPKVQRYKDYRQMLDKQKDLDGIVVATPDHMHAIIASSAMDVGKHVYVQKPLCWSVQEARHLAQKAKTTKLVTQMGNQGHSRDEARLGYEYITSGAIGEIREVHVWTNRPLGYWPQGVPRPTPPPERRSQVGRQERRDQARRRARRRVPRAEGALLGSLPRRCAAG